MLSTGEETALRLVSLTPTCCPEGNYFLLAKMIGCDLPRSSGTLATGLDGHDRGEQSD